MNDTPQTPEDDVADAKQRHGDKKREEKTLEKAVEDTFPASDPPAGTQPGSGITDSEVIDESKIRRDV